MKVVTGIRRCGKSVILKQISNEIKLKSSNNFYLNFADKIASAKISSAVELISYIESNRKMKNVIFPLL